MHAAPAIVALLVAALGWYYLFYSRAAHQLRAIEDENINRTRGLLRRVNAIIILLMALGIAFGSYKFDADRMPTAFLLTWSLVMLLLCLSVGLALFDLRLTWRLRRSIREKNR